MEIAVVRLSAQGVLLLAGLSLGGCATPPGGNPRGEVLSFDARNEYVIDVPAGGNELRAWLALPGEDELQRVRSLSVDVEAPAGLAVTKRETRDQEGNKLLFVSADNAGGKTVRVTMSFTVDRREAKHDIDPQQTRPITDDERAQYTRDLQPNTHVVMGPDVRARAAEIVGTESNPVRQSRRIYDWVLEHVTYWVKHPDRMKASPVGSSEYCMAQACGNCTDFHSLYAALSRAAGIPTRMVYGSFFKGPLNGADQDQSYHCWIEFFAPQLGWIPIDVAVADVFVDDFELTEANRRGVELTVADGYHGPSRELVDYYFGNLDARRVTWNRGRDLRLDPPARHQPINALPKAHVEVDGQPLAEKSGWTRKLTFRQR